VAVDLPAILKFAFGAMLSLSGFDPELTSTLQAAR